MDQHHPYRVVIVSVGTVLAAAFGVYLVVALRTFLVLLLVSGVIAASLDRPVNWVQRMLRLSRRGFAVLCVMLIGFAVVAGVVYLVAQPFTDQSSTLRQDFPERVERLKELPLVGPRLRNVDLRGGTERFFDELPERLEGNRELIVGVAETALTALALTATTIVVVVFFLLNGPRMAGGLDQLIVDPAREARARRIGHGMLDAVAGYVLGNLLISLCAGATVFVVLTVMRAPFPIVFAVLMAVLDLVPLVGATLGGILITGGVFVLDDAVWKTLVFVIVFVAYQQVENHSLYPLIMGKAVKIGTFPVFLITLAGTELAGILGALLAIPVGAAANVVVQDLLEERRRRAAERRAPAPAAV